jgi:hypothetical protein
MVTVPAGTFECACTTIVLTEGPEAGFETTQCVSVEYGVLILMEVFAPGPNGTVTGYFYAKSIP